MCVSFYFYYFSFRESIASFLTERFTAAQTVDPDNVRYHMPIYIITRILKLFKIFDNNNMQRYNRMCDKGIAYVIIGTGNSCVVKLTRTVYDIAQTCGWLCDLQTCGWLCNPQTCGWLCNPRHVGGCVTPRHVGGCVTPRHVGGCVTPRHVGGCVTLQTCGWLCNPQTCGCLCNPPDMWVVL